MNRAAGLATAEAGDTIIVRAANGTAMDLLITGTPVDSGTYCTIPVSVTTGTVTKGARTQFGILSPTPHGLPPAAPTARCSPRRRAPTTPPAGRRSPRPRSTPGPSTPTGHTIVRADGDQRARDPVDRRYVGGPFPSPADDDAHPRQGRRRLGNVDNTSDANKVTRRPRSTPRPRSVAPLNAQTGTTYTPVVADENLMVTLSNASAITVTLPAEQRGRVPGRRRSRLPVVGCRPAHVRRRHRRHRQRHPRPETAGPLLGGDRQEDRHQRLGRSSGTCQLPSARDHGVGGRHRRPPSTC